MKISQIKGLKLLPFILLIIYYVIIFIFPDITYMYRLIILISMIIIAIISFGILIPKESLQTIKKQKIVPLSFGLFTTFIIFIYFYYVA